MRMGLRDIMCATARGKRQWNRHHNSVRNVISSAFASTNNCSCICLRSKNMFTHIYLCNGKMRLGGRWSNWSFACAGLLAVLLPLWVRKRRLRGALWRKRKCKHKDVLAQVASVCSQYGLSRQGFLPARCLERLPKEFEDWEVLADQLPELNRSGRLAEAVESLPQLDAKCLDALEGAPKEVLQRAFLLLGALAHSYVHRHAVPWHRLGGCRVEADPSKCLPSQVAEPWLQVCAQLRMPPVLTAAATDLWNWRLEDASGGFTLDNLAQRISLTGTNTERAFHMVPCAMQAAAGEVLPKLMLADILVRSECDEELVELLLELADVVNQFQHFFQKIPGSVDRDVFYDVYRPLLNGFHPEGVRLQVASLDKTSLSVSCVKNECGSLLNTSKGPSAGQSTVILLLDSFLAVSHTGQGSAFQDEMLMYMPAEHRQMVLDFRIRWQDLEPLPAFIRGRKALGSAWAGDLQRGYDECVDALRALRRMHLSTVTKYLVRTSTGTGATPWRSLLQNMLDSTRSSLA